MSKGLLLHGFRHYTEHTEEDPISNKHTPTIIRNFTHSGPNPSSAPHCQALSVYRRNFPDTLGQSSACMQGRWALEEGEGEQ